MIAPEARARFQHMQALEDALNFRHARAATGPGLPGGPEPSSGAGGAFRYYLEAEARPSAVQAARHAARRALTTWGWGLDHIAADAELVLGELLANAVHATQAIAPAGQKIAAYLAPDLGRLFVLVWDCRAEPPAHAGHAGADAESGRGLTIVGALSEEWGCVFPPSGGKVVYAILAIPRMTGPDDARHTGRANSHARSGPAPPPSLNTGRRGQRAADDAAPLPGAAPRRLAPGDGPR